MSPAYEYLWRTGLIMIYFPRNSLEAQHDISPPLPWLCNTFIRSTKVTLLCTGWCWSHSGENLLISFLAFSHASLVNFNYKLKNWFRDHTVDRQHIDWRGRSRRFSSASQLLDDMRPTPNPTKGVKGKIVRWVKLVSQAYGRVRHW